MGSEWYDWARKRLAPGIHPDEALEVLAGFYPRRPVWGRAPHGVAILTVWGRTFAGRPLIVGVHKVSRFEQMVVSAVKMTPEQLADFVMWEVSRGERG